jgi:hypothetical protein
MSQTTVVKYIVLMQDQLSPGLQKQSAALSGVNAKLAQTNAQMTKANMKTRNLAKGFGGLQKAFAGVVAVAGTFRLLGESVKAWDKQERSIAQVKAGIEATNFAANKTLAQLKKEASDLQNNTLFGDEEILAGATAQLLTFTNIANEEFSRTQKVILDVATRLAAASDGAVDLKSVSIQLGKALNDPVKNLSALSRSGIQFTDQQKQMIKSLWEAGEQAEAQRLILAELEKQYGGSAEAAAAAGIGPFKQLKNTLGDLTELAGRSVGGILNKASKGLKTWIDDNAIRIKAFFDKITRFFDNIAKHGHHIKNAMKPLIDAQKEVFKGFGDVFRALTETKGAGDQTASTFEKIGKAIKFVTMPMKVMFQVMGFFLKIAAKVIRWLREMYDRFEGFRKVVNAILWPLKQVIKGFQWVSRQVSSTPEFSDAEKLQYVVNQYKKINDLKAAGVTLNDKQIWFLKNYKALFEKFGGQADDFGGMQDPFGGAGGLGGAGAVPGVPDTTVTNQTSITGAAPKVYNIRVDRLVEQIIIKTEQFKESKEEVRQTIVEALTEGLADIVLTE